MSTRGDEFVVSGSRPDSNFIEVIVMNNNNNNKQNKSARKQAAKVASLMNEVSQLKKQAKARGGNAQPSKARKRRNRGRGIPMLAGVGSDSRQNVQLSWSHIEKDELIAAVNGSVALTATKYAINPGLAATFPLGAPEAKRWTEWQAVFCEFYFKRTVSEFATQGTTGRVVLACDYSALNDAPASLQAAEALHSALGMPCTPQILLKLDPSILNKADPKYIRSQAVPGGSDVRLFDGGNLWFVTSGCQNGSEIGELRVRYHFLVRLPNLDDTYVSDSQQIAEFTGTGEAGGATGVAQQLLAASVTRNGLGVVNTGGSFVPPPGSYSVSVAVNAIFTGSSTDFRLGGFKNGAGLSAWNPRWTYVAATNTYLMIQLDETLVANGTDAFTFTTTGTYTTGALTQNVRIIWQKV